MARFMSSAAIVAAALARTPSDPTPISASIDGMADYDRTLHFCNLMRQARAFGSPQSPYDGNCTVDASGWPTQDFGVIVLTEGGGTPPQGMFYNGTYMVTAVGNATVGADLLSGVVLNQTYDASSNTLTAYVDVFYSNTSDGDLWIKFTNTQRDAASPVGSGLTNVTVLQPGCDASMVDAFAPAFLTMVSRFDSLRFMDLLSTNGNEVVNWTQRNTPATPSFVNGKGIPWEYVCVLANTVQRDIWINIPAHANDDYITHIASMLYACMDPSLFIYYEYSNEVWNWGFEQATYNLQAANASVVEDGDPYHLNFDGSNNPGYWAWRRTAYMCKHVADIFKTVFGDGNVGNGARVRPILSGQVSYPFVIYTGLTYIEAVWGPPATFFHAMAGAPYFNLGDANNNPALTVDQVIAAMNESVYNMSYGYGIGVSNPLASHVGYAYHYGLQMRAYEGGPDTSGPNDPVSLWAKANASIDPRMTTLCDTYFNNWYSYGAAMGPLNFFVAGATTLYEQYGTYGMLYDMRIPVTPKSIAIDTTRAKPRPASVAGTPVPTLAYNATYYIGHNEPVNTPVLEYLGVNSTFDYFVNVPTAGTLSVAVNASTASTGGQLQVFLSWNQSVIVTVPNTGDWGKYAPAPPALLQAPAGTSVVRLKVLTDRGYNIASIAFTMA